MRYSVRFNNPASLLIRGALFSVLALLFVLFGYFHAQAAEIGVGTGCSVVDAITSANTDSSVGGCTAGSGPDTIVLSDTLYSFSTADNSFFGDNNALPPITSTIIISPILGVNSTLQRTPLGCPVVNSNQNFRFFVIASNGDLTLNHVSLDFGCSEDGGAIFNLGGKLSLFSSTLFSNTAAFNGGAIYSPSGEVNINSTTVQSNTAGVSGGGLFFFQGRVENSHFFGNHASGEGGAIFVLGPPDKFLIANDIFENSAGEEGSALYLEDTYLHMDNNLFYSNVTTATNLAAIALGTLAGPSTLLGQHNTMVAGSQPANAIAAGLEFRGDQVFLTDTIFSGFNVGLSAQLSATVIANGVLWDNTTTPTQTLTGGVITVSHDYVGNAAFVNPANDNYHLTSDSQAINRGISNIPPQDYDGIVRPVGLESDLGYVEFVPTISINISKTVGTDANSCASSHQITVQSNTAVFYCFALQNTGDITFTQHTFTDPLLGINSILPITLGPGASVQITRSLISALGPVTATQSVTNTATVTSTDLAPSSLSSPDISVQGIGQFGTPASDSDSAVVITEEPTDLPGAEQPEPRDNRLYLPSALH